MLAHTPTALTQRVSSARLTRAPDGSLWELTACAQHTPGAHGAVTQRWASARKLHRADMELPSPPALRPVASAVRGENDGRGGGGDGREHKIRMEVVAGVVQLAFNVAIAGLMLYLVFGFVLSVRGDVMRRVSEEVARIEGEILLCKHDYEDNRCGEAENVVPRMRGLCAEWERCKNRNASEVAKRTRLTAETVAEVVNSFLEPISVKAMLGVFGLALCVTVLSNLTLEIVRRKILDSAARKREDDSALAARLLLNQRPPTETPVVADSHAVKRRFARPTQSYGLGDVSLVTSKSD